MLRIKGLRVLYGRVPALHGVTLHVEKGETVALVGPNGAGKTTTLSAVFGLVQVAAGTIEFEGASLVGARPEAIVRSGLALVPEGRHIFGSLSVAGFFCSVGSLRNPGTMRLALVPNWRLRPRIS